MQVSIDVSDPIPWRKVVLRKASTVLVEGVPPVTPIHSIALQHLDPAPVAFSNWLTDYLRPDIVDRLKERGLGEREFIVHSEIRLHRDSSDAVVAANVLLSSWVRIEVLCSYFFLTLSKLDLTNPKHITVEVFDEYRKEN